MKPLLDFLRKALSFGRPETPAFVRGIDDLKHLKMIRLQGRLDNATIPSLTEFFERERSAHGTLDKDIVLDFRKVEFVETAAVAQLLKISATLKEKRHHLGLLHVPDMMQDMLKILKVDHAFVIFHSQREAFDSVLRWSDEWQ